MCGFMSDQPPLPAYGPGTSTIKAEFQLAQQVLMSVMPRGFATDAYTFDLRYRPMIGIGGDHAAVETYPDAGLFSISDVTGHGIAAALMVRDISGFVRGLTSKRTDPRKLVTELNKYVLRIFSDSDPPHFMTFFCGLLDFKTQRLTVCGAGHPPVIVAGPNRPEPLLLYCRNPILGIGPFPARKAVDETIPLLAGDRVLFYTDGVMETRNAGGEEFGLERLARLSVPEKGDSLGDSLDAIIRETDVYRGGDRQRDDILVAGIDVRDPAGSTKRLRKLS